MGALEDLGYPRVLHISSADTTPLCLRWRAAMESEASAAQWSYSIPVWITSQFVLPYEDALLCAWAALILLALVLYLLWEYGSARRAEARRRSSLPLHEPRRLDREKG